MLKVSELIEKLNKLPPDTIVILSSDGEGNNYSPLCDDFSTGIYIPYNSYSGYIKEDDMVEDDMVEDDMAEDDMVEDVDPDEIFSGFPCVVLTPIN